MVALMIRFAVSYTDEIDDYNRTSDLETIITTMLFNFPHKRVEDGYANNSDSDLTDPRLNVAKKILDIIILCISIVVVATIII